MTLASVLAALACAAASEPPATPADRAEAVLRSANAFRDVQVGEDGATPAEVHAYRALLAAPDGAARFRRLAAAAPLAGRLYALCGLFFRDPPAFDAELARFRGRPDTKVTQQVGCFVSEESLATLLGPLADAPRMSHSGSFREWLRTGFNARWRDVAGGATCYRLRFGSSVLSEWLEDPGKAPDEGPGDALER